MAGVVLETLSTKKLIVLCSSLFLLLVVFFLVGGLIAPAPSNVQQILGTKCILPKKAHFWKHWSIPRGPRKCDNLNDFQDKRITADGIEANQIVFSFWIPGPKDGKQAMMYPWFQSILSILMVDITYNPENPHEDGNMTMEVKLGYRREHDNETDWKTLAESTEKRQLECSIDQDKMVLGTQYNCSVVSLFELGSCAHDFYLLNLRLPTVDLENLEINFHLGNIEDIWLVAIHQNGGFTKVWFTLKTVVFPIVLAALIWYWRRINKLNRFPTLLEKTLFCLGIALTFLNLPVDWLSLFIEAPFMLLYTDIRQGIFYATLLSFWLIFAGEHMMDQLERNRIVLYWTHLAAVAFGCIAMFVFEMCERGVQLQNPFYSIWVTDVGRKLGLAFITIAGIFACLYFLFLCYMIFKVFRNISAKKSALPHMSSARKKYYLGVIYRFKFLMIATLLCAALTVIFFIISQVHEGQWKWGEESQLQYTSAFFTGVYGMWNVYVLGLLALYAPSHKFVPEQEAEDSKEEEMHLTQIPSETSTAPSEASVLTAFVSKTATD